MKPPPWQSKSAIRWPSNWHHIEIVHQTEIDGVRLNLADEEAVREAFDSIRMRLLRENRLEAMEGVLVQPMMTDGVEVMMGSPTIRSLAP